MGSPRHIVILLCMSLMACEASRILMLSPFLGKSQKNVFYGLGKALVARGHEVVLFSAFKPSSPVPGIKEVVPENLAEVFMTEKWPSQIRAKDEGPIPASMMFWTMFRDGPKEALYSSEIDQLLNEKFDLVVLSAFSYSLYFVPYKLNIPYILLAPISSWPLLSAPMGNPTLPSVNPLFMLAATDHMSFFQRVKSVLGHGAMHLLMRHIYMPYCDRLISEKYGDEIPSIADIERNASLLFLSGSEVTDYHQPLLPNTILIGGTHCERPNPIPKEIGSFIGSEEFIYFSLGSVARPEDMIENEKSSILEGLGRLPYKVLLKWDTTNRTGIPANIFPSKWLPQQDILGSNRCKLFISHGGFASVLESMCHGIPMLIMPVSADQFFNAENAKRLGIANVLHWEDLTPVTFAEKVHESLSVEFVKAAKYRRDLLKSRPISSKKLAVFWVEHVISHKGAPHLKSVASELYWFQYYSLDVLAFLLITMIVVVKVMSLMLKFCFRPVSEKSKTSDYVKCTATADSTSEKCMKKD